MDNYTIRGHVFENSDHCTRCGAEEFESKEFFAECPNYFDVEIPIAYVKKQEVENDVN